MRPPKTNNINITHWTRAFSYRGAGALALAWYRDQAGARNVQVRTALGPSFFYERDLVCKLERRGAGADSLFLFVFFSRTLRNDRVSAFLMRAADDAVLPGSCQLTSHIALVDKMDVTSKGNINIAWKAA